MAASEESGRRQPPNKRRLDLTHHLPKQQHLNLQLLLASTAGREKKLEHTTQSLPLLLTTTAGRRGEAERRRYSTRRPIRLIQTAPDYRTSSSFHQRSRRQRGGALNSRPGRIWPELHRHRAEHPLLRQHRREPNYNNLDYAGASPPPSPVGHAGRDGLGSGRQLAALSWLLFTRWERGRGK
jgi:hypothetical protein